MTRRGALAGWLLPLSALTLLCAGAPSPGALEAQEGQPPITQPSRRQEAPSSLKVGQSCLECHAEVASQTWVHNPVRNQRCDLCHLQAQLTRHEFTRPKDIAATCQECHPLPARNHVHEPVQKGQCLQCHQPHHSDQRYLLRAESELQLCTQCHTAQAGEGMAHVHGPVAFGLCTICHSPHASYEEHLMKASPRETCLGCHEEMRQRLEPPFTTHHPVEQDCSLCHDPHASQHPFQLKQETQQLCQDCHKPLMERVRATGQVHAALTTEEGCSHCHDTHSSVLPRLLRRPVGELCLSCHDQPIERPDGTSLSGIGQVMAQSQFLHGPVQDGNCAACHDPHGSKNFSLLHFPYPKEFYAPFAVETYQLCFECHDAAAFLFPETQSHTNFKDGERNLHYLHVNMKDKGRTCRACHETHASNHPFHMTDSVPFGSWMIPLNYVRTPSGGSCAPGCHKPRSYVNQPGGGQAARQGLLQSVLPAAKKK